MATGKGPPGDEVDAAEQGLTKKVEDGTVKIEEDVFGITSAANMLGDAIVKSTAEVETLRTELEAIVEKLQKSYTTANKNMEIYSKQSKEAMDTTDTQVKDRLVQVTDALTKETQAAAKKTEALAKAIYNDLLTKIDQLKDDAATQLERSHKAIPSPATHAILTQLKAGECIRHSI